MDTKSLLRHCFLILWTTFALSTGAIAASIGTAEDLKRRFFEETNRSKLEEEADHLAQAQKHEFMVWLRERAANKEDPNLGMLEDILFYLGDDEMVKDYTRRWVYSEGPSVGGPWFLKVVTRNPQMIESMAPALYRKERYEVAPTDTVEIPPSFIAADMSLYILARSAAFTEKVNEWAHSVEDLSSDPYRRREIMRSWWRDNAQYFKGRDYKAVQPGSEPQIAAQAQRPPAASSPAPPAAATSPLQHTTSNSANSPARSPQTGTPLWIFWAVALGSLALIAALLAVLFKARK